jgi:metallo-beta-lactamase class B
MGRACVIGRGLGILVLLGIVQCGLACAQTAEERVAWNRPIEPFRLIGNIHYVGAAGVSAFLITTPEGAFLLDGGLPETAALIRANIETLGFRVTDVKYLLNSHAHFDHAGGLDALKQASGAAMVASSGDAPALKAGGPDMPSVAVDRVVRDGEALTLGGTTMIANVTPGHTKGCTSWSTTVTEGGRSYRVLFNCSVSIVDRLVGNTAYPSIVADYERTFRRFREFPADVFLSSHPYAFELEAKRVKQRAGGANPFVDPSELRRFMDQAERQFREALKKQQK